MDNDDLVEVIYSGDEFHSELQSMVAKFGRGEAVAIVWEYNGGPEPRYTMKGTVVCQLQYGQTAYRFRVLTFQGGYTLFFRGRQKTIAADYFEHSLAIGCD